MHGQVETLTTGEFAMECLRFGRGDDTLVILPGASVQSVMGAADAVVEAYAPLAESFTVCLLDYRRVLPDSCSVRTLARDAREALRELGFRRVHLFGVSLGGMVAQVVAIEDPGLVEKLILGSTAPKVSAGCYRLFERWAELAEAGEVRGLYQEFGQAVYPPKAFERLWEQLDDAAIASVTADDLVRFTVLMRSMKGFDVTGELERITCPVFAIGSCDDRIFGADGTAQIADRLGNRPDFQQHLYEGFGHAAYDTAPDYKDRMLRFLKCDR